MWEVRIPDPDCKSILPQFDPFCRDVIIPVDDGKVQAGLRQFDSDHNHILDANDIFGDPATLVPGGAANRLAELLIGTQYIVGSKFKFPSRDAALDFVKSQIAVNRAYDTVQFLQGLKSHNINDGAASTEHEFNAADWEKIVSQLGVAGHGYAVQTQAAYISLEAFIASSKMVATTLAHDECARETCWTVVDAWIMDPTSFPGRMRGMIVDSIQKMAAINSFARYDEIECEGLNCPSNSESDHPLDKKQWHGNRIAIREDDTAKGEVQFLQLKAPESWSNTPDQVDYLPERLAYMTFTPTSVSK